MLYGCDDNFWKKHRGVPLFEGLKVTQDAIAEARIPTLKRVQCNKQNDDLIFDRPGHLVWGGNSGLQAMNLAAQFGAKKIILVGFDMRIDRGLHWHGKHPIGMNNPTEGNVARWRRATDNAATAMRAHGIDVVNVSPVSALTAYPKMSLEKALREVSEPLKVLAVGNVVSDISEISNFSGVYSYFIQRELAAAGVKITRTPRPLDYATLDLGDAEHVIAFGLRQFQKAPAAASAISSLVAGAVCQFSDGTLSKPECDLTFAFKGIPKGGNVIIGWGADPAIAKPAQEPRLLRILIDHPDYVKGRGDMSAPIKADVERFAAGPLWRKGFKEIEVETLASPKAGDGNARSFPEMCASYGRAHVAIVTHPESVGLWVLEAALAGALIVSPMGFMPEDLLRTVRRIEYQRSIPWELILRKINPAASRKMASSETWGKVAAKIIAALREFRK